MVCERRFNIRISTVWKRALGRLLFVSAFLLLAALSGCVHIPQKLGYAGPTPRPAELVKYYSYPHSFTGYKEVPLERTDDYSRTAIQIETEEGPVKIDYYARPERSSDLIFIFPILGGKYLFESHFAAYFARHGFDAAVIQRNGDFKDPTNLPRIEEIFRAGVVRDRITLDFFEQVYGKRNFGSFGISRGALNVAVLAGIDPRLQHNVMVLGGTDLVRVFRDSNERGVKKYRNQVMERWNIDKGEFFEYLRANLKTDPKALAKYIDANNTLLVLAAFDKTVPFGSGLNLRRAMGEPETIFLAADHYTSLLYTQFLAYLFPKQNAVNFSPDYLESEALIFYRDKFGRRSTSAKQMVLSALRVPFDIVASLRCAFKQSCSAVESERISERRMVAAGRGSGANYLAMRERREPQATMLASTPPVLGILSAPPVENLEK